MASDQHAYEVSSPYGPGEDDSDGAPIESLPSASARAARAGFSGFWTHPATVVGAVGVMLLLVTSLAVVALRGDTGSTARDGQGSGTAPAGAAANGGPLFPQQPAVPSGVASGAVVTGGGAAAGHSQSGRAAGVGGNPAGRTATARTTPSSAGAQSGPVRVLRQGTLALSLKTGMNLADLDTGVADSEAAANNGMRPDIVLGKPNLKARGGAGYAVGPQVSVPTRDRCAAVPAGGWVDTVTADAVVPDRSMCVLTDEGRLAVATFTAVTRNAGGKLTEVSIRYTTWKKSTDT